MPGARHSVTPADSAITIQDIVAARADYQRTRPKSPADATDSSRWRTLAPFPLAAVLGLVIGACIPTANHGWWLRLSNAMGWGYALSWAMAEYPALYFNWQEKGVTDDSLDDLLYRLIGNAAYVAFNIGLLATRLCSPQSKDGCGAKYDSVHLNDAFFSVHSLLCSLALIWQLAVYNPRRVSPLISLQFWVVSVSAFSVAAGCLVLALQDSSYLTLPNYLYGLSMLRIASCIVELLPGTPQHQEKKGGHPGTLKGCLAAYACWSLCLGGVLSLGQQGLDAYATRSPGVITGNLTKLAIAALTLAFGIASLFSERVAGEGAGGSRGGAPGRAEQGREGGSSPRVGLTPEAAEEARGDELTEALLGAEESNRPTVKNVRVKKSLRTLST